MRTSGRGLLFRIAGLLVHLPGNGGEPTLVSLALNSVPAHHGPFAGILCTGIMGGAVIPLLIGSLGDRFGLRTGMLLLYVTFGCVLSVGLWARPLINNALLGTKP